MNSFNYSLINTKIQPYVLYSKLINEDTEVYKKTETEISFFDEGDVLSKLKKMLDKTESHFGFDMNLKEFLYPYKTRIRKINIAGEYMYEKQKIIYYKMNQKIKDIIKIHERFHAFHHLLKDDKGDIWYEFANTPSYYLELLAQLFTYDFLKKFRQNLVKVFTDLSSHQSFKYKTWKLYDNLNDNQIVDLYWFIRNGRRISYLDDIFKYLEQSKPNNLIADKPSVTINTYNTNILNDLKNLCINTSRNLVNMLNETDGLKEGFTPNLETKMIFPKYERELLKGQEVVDIEYNDGKIRISEQEARFQLCLAIERYYKEYYYSIETPTIYNYIFSEKGKKIELQKHEPEPGKHGIGKSARFDLSIFFSKDFKFEQAINVECKAHNIEENQIKKDFLKLLIEQGNGVFFHLLNNIDKGALDKNKNNQTGILSKYILSMKYCFEKHEQEIKNYKDKNILFAICILHPSRVLLLKDFKLSKLKELGYKNYIDDFFHLAYYTQKEFSDLNGWEMINLQ